MKSTDLEEYEDAVNLIITLPVNPEIEDEESLLEDE